MSGVAAVIIVTRQGWDRGEAGEMPREHSVRKPRAQGVQVRGRPLRARPAYVRCLSPALLSGSFRSLLVGGAGGTGATPTPRMRAVGAASTFSITSDSWRSRHDRDKVRCGVANAPTRRYEGGKSVSDEEPLSLQLLVSRQRCRASAN